MPENRIGWFPKTFFFLALIVAFISWGEYFYKRYWPLVPSVVYGDIKILNEGKKVCAGDRILYELDIEKFIQLPVKIKRSLANGYLITFDDSEPPTKPLGRQKVRVSLHVPKSADVGMWTLKWTAAYTVTSDRTINIDAKSEPFKVEKCK